MIHGCSNMLRLSILCSGSFFSIFSIRSISSSDVVFSIMFKARRTSFLIEEVFNFLIVPYSISSLRIYYSNAFRSLALKGKKPKTIACSISPSDQMSILVVDFMSPWSSSGAMNLRLPKLIFSSRFPEIDPKIPKSTTFKFIDETSSLPFFSYFGTSANITFWNFMSLWMILLLWQ